MKKEWADKWVKALRSGEFKQGIGALKDKNNNYCCLGVLCAIAFPEKSTNNTTLNHIFESNDPVTGMKTPFGKMPNNRNSLWELNDGYAEECKKHSFNEIADIIEKEWENL